MSQILVVDDQMSLCILLRAVLTKCGYTVFIAPNAVEGWALFEEHSIDLLLVDVVMPQVDGLTLCRWIRQQSDVPIILISALSKTGDIEESLSSGMANEYIGKPFVIEDVIKRVEALV